MTTKIDQRSQLIRIIELIRLLNTRPHRTVPQLARQLNISDKRIYAYIKVLESVGYVIVTDDQSRKSLDLSFSEYGNGVINDEEIGLIYRTLKESNSKNPLLTELLHKLDGNLSLIPLADALPQLHASKMIRLSRFGIENKRVLMLIGYHSLTSNKVSNRRIAALELTEDYRYLLAWDLDKDEPRQFKLSRIRDIDILDDRVTENYIASPMDIFGLTGDSWKDIQIKLSPIAHHLMVEDFPSSIGFIRQISKSKDFIFDGRVRHWKGIGRFCLGLPGEVEIIAPEEFRDYLNKKNTKF